MCTAFPAGYGMYWRTFFNNVLEQVTPVWFCDLGIVGTGSVGSKINGLRKMPNRVFASEKLFEMMRNETRDNKEGSYHPGWEDHAMLLLGMINAGHHIGAIPS